jgi:hypothetical protein
LSIGRWVIPLVVTTLAVSAATGCSRIQSLALGSAPRVWNGRTRQPPELLQARAAPRPTTLQPGGGSTTPPDFKVAFLGDQGLNRDARAVLALIKAEDPSLVLQLGDLGYEEGDPRSPLLWETQIDQALGRDVPLLSVIGNHDVERWRTYERLLLARQARIEGAVCSGRYGVDSACAYEGLFIIRSGIGTLPDQRDHGPHVAYLESQLAESSATWKICAWHKNQRAMQVGDKRNEVGWDAYEVCREAGALIVTAHEHSYSRTKTLVDIPRRTVSPDWPDPDVLTVAPGSTFVVVAGLGGDSIRGQERCRPTTYPYGCDGEWASIYTADQGARPGALFVTFHVDGDPKKARGYFKNIDREIIDTFTVQAR